MIHDDKYQGLTKNDFNELFDSWIGDISKQSWKWKLVWGIQYFALTGYREFEKNIC